MNTWFSSGRFPSHFPTKTLCTFLISHALSLDRCGPKYYPTESSVLFSYTKFNQNSFWHFCSDRLTGTVLLWCVHFTHYSHGRSMKEIRPMLHLLLNSFSCKICSLNRPLSIWISIRFLCQHFVKVQWLVGIELFLIIRFVKCKYAYNM